MNFTGPWNLIMIIIVTSSFINVFTDSHKFIINFPPYPTYGSLIERNETPLGEVLRYWKCIK